MLYRKNAENSNSIYRLIKEKVRIEELSAFLERLEEFSEVYNTVIQKNSKYEAIRYFNIKRNQQIRSLLCAIFVLQKKEIISEQIKENALKQLMNFFFVFNTTQQTSNRTDKIISSISYKVYNCSREKEFKIIFSEFMYEIENFISQRDYKNMFESNQSFKYSNKDSTLKRNRNLVKFILEQVCALKQSDTKMDINNLTIEHLLSDDGSPEHSSIWNLTLTSEEINSEELKNKNIIEKVNILKEKSTIKENQSLEVYLGNDTFNFDKRKEDLIEIIFDKVFVFNPSVFKITKDEIQRYKDIESIIKSTEDYELMQLLKEEGYHFERKINNDPKMSELKIRWESICCN